MNVLFSFVWGSNHGRKVSKSYGKQWKYSTFNQSSGLFCIAFIKNVKSKLRFEKIYFKI